MLDDRRRSYGPTMFTASQLLEMTANEVANATVKAAESIRKTRSIGVLNNVVRAVDASVKGQCKTISDFKKREGMISSVIEIIEDIGSYHAIRQHLVPAVRYVILHDSAISKARQSKVLNQWSEIVGYLDAKVI